MESNIIDLCGEPPSRVQSAAFYALKELAPGQSVALLTAAEPSLMMQSLDLQLGHKLAWTITEEDARWRVVVRHRADAPPRDVFDLLLAGHQQMDRLLAQALRALNDADVAAAAPLIVRFSGHITRHVNAENEVLAPFLGAESGAAEAVAMMLREHAEIVAQLEVIEDGLLEGTGDAGELGAFCAILSGTLAKHEHREENVLFPLWRAAWARKPAAEREETMRRVQAALSGGEGGRQKDEG